MRRLKIDPNTGLPLPRGIRYLPKYFRVVYKANLLKGTIKRINVATHEEALAHKERLGARFKYIATCEPRYVVSITAHLLDGNVLPICANFVTLDEAIAELLTVMVKYDVVDKRIKN